MVMSTLMAVEDDETESENQNFSLVYEIEKHP